MMAKLPGGRRIWPSLIIGATIALVAFMDLIQQSISDMPFYWAAIIIGATFLRWRTTVFLSAIAIALSVIAGLRWGYLTEPEYLERLVMGVVLSIVAANIAIKIQQRDEQLLSMSLTDPLTGLPNRLLLYERLDSRLRQRNCLTPTVVIFIDLDNFKHVNDYYGHAIGDAMLKEVANRLTEVVRSEDTAARLGGDEFVIMCTSILDVAGAEILCRRLALALREPFNLSGVEMIGGGSVGCVLFHHGQADAERLVSLADGALREAKEFHKGGYRLIEVADDHAERIA